MRDFLEAYREQAPDLMEFYAQPVDALWRTGPGPPPWPAELADAIRTYNAERGGTAAFEGNETVIITGQQPALFTGPLYTIYKAVTTIKAAGLHAERTGLPTVPIFWIGSEDHDFDEARTVHYLTRQHSPKSYSYTPPVDVDGMPMYRVPLNGALHETIDQLAAQTNGSEYREAVQQFLHETLDAADSLSDWTTRLLIRLFRDTPLVFFAPHLPVARRLAADVMNREIEEPLETTRLVNEAARQLAALDFEPQVLKADNECGFFLEVDGRRRKVLFEDDTFEIPETGQHFEPKQLQDLLVLAPERFSPNVALRCIVQQRLFPARAYVAGPSELAYWAQLRGVFERHSLPMPVVYPRAQCVLTSLKLNKLMDKFDLAPAELIRHEDELTFLANRNSSNSPLLEKIHAQQEAVDRQLEALSRDLQKNSPTAARMVDSLERDIHGKFSQVERAVLHEDEARHEAIRRQVKRLCDSIAPGRKPQERVYTIFSFLFERGPGLIDQLIESVDIESFEMNEVTL